MNSSPETTADAVAPRSARLRALSQSLHDSLEDAVCTRTRRWPSCFPTCPNAAAPRPPWPTWPISTCRCPTRYPVRRSA
jgi:hypothetical protein